MTKSSNENGSAIDSPVTREDQNGHHAANGGTATPTQASTTNLRETPPVDVKGKSKGKYSESMKILIPFRSTKKDRHIFPVDQSGLFSNIYSGWMNSIVWKATKGKVEEPDIYDLAPNDSSDSAGQRLWRLWQEEVQSKGIEKASYYRVMLRAIKTRWIVASLVLFCSLACSFISASVIIKELLAYAETTNPNINVGIALVCGMLCTEMIRVLAISFMFVLNYRTGVRLMGGSLSLVFKKILRLRSLKDKSVGELVNLLSNDGMRLFEFVAFGNFIVNTPLLFIPGIIYTCIILGPWALLGVLTFIVFLPLQERKMLETAGFVQAMSFAVTPAVPVIAAVLSFIGHTLSGNNLTPAQSVLIMEELEPYKDKPSDRSNAIEITAATFGWDALDRKGEEKTEKGKDSGKMQNGGPPGGRGPPGKNGKKGKKGKKGKDGDKEEEEEEEKDKTIPTIFDIDLTLPKGSLLGVCGGVGSGKSSLISGILAQMRLLKGKVATDGNYAYVAQQAWILNSSVRDNILFGQPFDKEKYDRVCYACSLLPDFQQLPDGDQTEIGERGVNISGGQKQRVSLARALYADRDIYLLDDPLSAVDAHVGKHIFNNYVKKELKDKTVLFVTHQLQYLSDCDEIIVFNDGRITEKGKHRQLMNLNGEYANLILNFHEDEEDEEDADLIVEQEDVVIETESPLQRNPSVQRSLRRRDSKRASQRSFQRQDSVRGSMNLKRSYSIRSVHSTASETAGHIEEPLEREDLDPESEGKKEDGDPQKLVTEEEKYKGTVAGATYWSYVKAGGGVIVCTLTMLLFILNTASMVFSNWWLTYWLNQGSGVPLNQSDPSTFNLTENPRLNFYILIYGMTVVAMLVIAVIKGYCYVKVTLGASSSMHDSVFASIFRCPMKFFDVTPTGRILNRFSRDLDEIDVRLPLTMQLFLDNVWVVFASILNVCIVFPWFLVALGPLGILFALVLVFFRHIIRELKRFDNVRRSPWFSHVTASIQGLSTIHAYEKNDNVMDKFATLLDKQNAAFLMYHYSTRWLAVRLDSVALSINVLAALMVVVFQGTIPASWAGLALSYAIQTSGLLQLCVRMASETESRFTCVERITHYADNLEQEAPEQIKGSDPAESWPDQGVLQFNRYQMRYRESLPLVLKDIQCNIRPRESVGIVGRTGSGKSSLGVALFRLVEPTGGSILIDGVDTSKIGLQSLRSKLSIIPQDPVLFVGTIRYNLDPFNQYKDPELWRALERTYMKDAISNLEKQLEAPVVENGENFSVGERQLICMARALLRNSKIILLDEATAAIDSETDSLIQKTIHEAFTDCTMLTIAHRLNTVLNSDRIMVMEDGKLVEFDTPAALMSDPNSRFSAMMAATGSDVSKYLANNPVPALPDSSTNVWTINLHLSFKPFRQKQKPDLLSLTRASHTKLTPCPQSPGLSTDKSKVEQN
uniref:Uncharacterized protein n=1 Tax=Branchiostoma floridae TaxID=7739 RepID=C3ZEY9_BRAFL|eukprot:XP_002593284.1 hypothetical protein BRAFLDRAFT_123638 [Branchiostoma floridae]